MASDIVVGIVGASSFQYGAAQAHARSADGIHTFKHREVDPLLMCDHEQGREHDGGLAAARHRDDVKQSDPRDRAAGPPVLGGGSQGVPPGSPDPGGHQPHEADPALCGWSI